jgi:4'-phosphopantetheinyl transferase
VLRTADGESPVHFNLSHSHGLAVYAFARNRELGIDLELIRQEFAGESIAERNFSARELDEWHRLPPELRAEAFFLCWTRKEAYVKARGEGLQIPLASFSVTLTPGQPEELHSLDGGRWLLHSFQPAPGYAAAVVGEGKDWRLLQWDWRA